MLFTSTGRAQQCNQCQNVSPVLGHFMAWRSWQCGGLTCNEVLSPRAVWRLKETRKLSLFFFSFFLFPLLHSSPPESAKGLKPVEACLSSEFLWCSFKNQVFRTQKIISNLPEGSFYVVLLFMRYFMKWQSYHWLVIIQHYCWNILLFYVI